MTIFRLQIGKMSERRRLVYSIIQFVQEEIKSEELSDDAKESLEVKQHKTRPNGLDRSAT